VIFLVGSGREFAAAFMAIVDRHGSLWSVEHAGFVHVVPDSVGAAGGQKIPIQIAPPYNRYPSRPHRREDSGYGTRQLFLSLCSPDSRKNGTADIRGPTKEEARFCQCTLTFESEPLAGSIRE
jgi:hypothetical protein